VGLALLLCFFLLFGRGSAGGEGSLGRLVNAWNAANNPSGRPGECAGMIDKLSISPSFSRAISKTGSPAPRSARPCHAGYWHPPPRRLRGSNQTGLQHSLAPFRCHVLPLALVCGAPVNLETLGEDARSRRCRRKDLRARAVAPFRVGDAPAGSLADRRGRAFEGGRGLGRLPDCRRLGPVRLRMGLRPPRFRNWRGPFARAISRARRNNAMIVASLGVLEMALRAIVSPPWAPAGQRCTSLRRLIVHESGGYDS